ncbi:MAG: ROK family protein [Pseudomonadota bacterium]
MTDLFDPPPADPPVYGCIEAGGTKFVLGVLAGTDDTHADRVIPTGSPADTLAAALAFFTEHVPAAGYAAFGIASFGPLDLDPLSPRWGTITDTPKPGWRDTAIVAPFAAAFDCPVGLDTDVGAAALAEGLWGAGVDAELVTYLTVGTGIGGGALVNGRLLHGARHPEMGHYLPQRHPRDDFIGSCPYHGACLEGLASGPTIIARWGAPLSELPQDHAAHDIIAFYLAQSVIAQQAMLSPRRIVLGGGVMQTPGLLTRIRDTAARLGNGFFAASTDYERLVVDPALGTRSGLLGALALAQAARR